MIIGLLQLSVSAEVLKGLVDHFELLLWLRTLVGCVSASKRLVKKSACCLSRHDLLARASCSRRLSSILHLLLIMQARVDQFQVIHVRDEAF